MGFAEGELLSGDGVSGALGAVLGEWIGEISADVDGVKDVTRLEESLAIVKQQGIHKAPLISGLTAALLGKSVSAASITAGIASENNAFLDWENRVRIAQAGDFKGLVF